MMKIDCTTYEHKILVLEIMLLFTHNNLHEVLRAR